MNSFQVKRANQGFWFYYIACYLVNGFNYVLENVKLKIWSFYSTDIRIKMNLTIYFSCFLVYLKVYIKVVFGKSNFAKVKVSSNHLSLKKLDENSKVALFISTLTSNCR